MILLLLLSGTQRITLPLKDDLLTVESKNAFKRCKNLKHLELVEKEVLHETVIALLMDEWRNI